MKYFQAIVDGNVDEIKNLLSNPDTAGEVTTVSEDGKSPLYIATTKNNVEIMKLLIEGGADINRTSYDGITPLGIASQMGHLDAVKFLLECPGIDLNIKDEDGHSIIEMAVVNSQTEVADILRSAMNN